ncbi:MAG TPA: hypothetical protein VF533_03495, partial [Solirubrobacteraceae bacterium]
MRVGLATIQRERHEHLARQAGGVARQLVAPERYLVVSMDPDPPRVAAGEVLHLPVPPGRPLPLAAARNAALDALSDLDLAILLDVDCIPGPELVGRYAAAARGPAGAGLLAGPVGRLEARDARAAAPSQAALARARGRGDGRPAPPAGVVVPEPRVELFWSLSFAVGPAVHARIGGFDPGYVGYGAEDTDYAFRARAAGV